MFGRFPEQEEVTVSSLNMDTHLIELKKLGLVNRYNFDRAGTNAGKNVDQQSFGRNIADIRPWLPVTGILVVV